MKRGEVGRYRRGIAGPNIPTMPVLPAYTFRRRLAMQLALIALLGGTLALAALLSQRRNEQQVVTFGQPVQWESSSGQVLRAPTLVGWSGWKLASDNTGEYRKSLGPRTFEPEPVRRSVEIRTLDLPPDAVIAKLGDEMVQKYQFEGYRLASRDETRLAGHRTVLMRFDGSGVDIDDRPIPVSLLVGVSLLQPNRALAVGLAVIGRTAGRSDVSLMEDLMTEVLTLNAEN